MKRGLIVLIVLFLLALPLILADQDSQVYSCISNNDCQICEAAYQNIYQCYCSSQTGTCWINTSSTGPSPPDQTLSNNTNSLTNNNLAGQAIAVDTTDLQTAISLLQQQVAASEIRNQQ